MNWIRAIALLGVITGSFGCASHKRPSVPGARAVLGLDSLVGRWTHIYETAPPEIRFLFDFYGDEVIEPVEFRDVIQEMESDELRLFALLLIGMRGVNPAHPELNDFRSFYEAVTAGPLEFTADHHFIQHLDDGQQVKPMELVSAGETTMVVRFPQEGEGTFEVLFYIVFSGPNSMTIETSTDATDLVAQMTLVRVD